MRRKINYQVPEYVQNNELICFGLSSQDVEEWQIQWTPKAEKDLAIVSTIINISRRIILSIHFNPINKPCRLALRWCS